MTRAFKLYSEKDKYEAPVSIPKPIVKDDKNNVPIKVTNSIKVYFSQTHGKITHELTNELLLPNKLARINIKKFNDIYLEQLEKVIVIESMETNITGLIELLTIYREINKGNYPIRIVSNNYKKLLPKICYVLNMFFNKYFLTLDSIYGCFNSHIDSEAEKPNKELKNPTFHEERPLEPLKDDDLVID